MFLRKEAVGLARSKKRRKICFAPQNRMFYTQLDCSQTVTLLFEELEALRLCDFEHMDQDCAAQNMEVSRGTYQRILRAAREKVADALCSGKNIRIGGGACEISDSTGCTCRQRCRICRKTVSPAFADHFPGNRIPGQEPPAQEQNKKEHQ
ncbi:MAG: DUF134 domain-containing protein [Oscillospiraceae bacterium]